MTTHTITKRLYDLTWEATETACRAEAAKEVWGGLVSPNTHYNMAFCYASDFLIKQQVKSSTTESVAAQIAAELTFMCLGDYIEAVDIVDDNGALDVLRLDHDADSELIKSRYRFLIEKLDTQNGGEVARVLLERVRAAYQQLQRIGRV
jgi:hypothetical protein